nr:MAG: RNA-dependent RNA polymerase [Mitoviridae sp.]
MSGRHRLVSVSHLCPHGKEKTMTISQGIQDDLCKKLRMVGLPKGVVLPLVNQLTRQVLAEGAENVVKRLKLLKQAAVMTIAGRPTEFPWIKHNQHGPKGPWRPVWRLLSGDFRKRKRALNAMMVYASFVLPKGTGPTSTQEAKFLNSVEYKAEIVDARERKFRTAWENGTFKKGLRALTYALHHVQFDDLQDPPDLWVHLGRHYGFDRRSVRRAEKHLSLFLNQLWGRPFQAFPSVQKFLGYVGEDHRSDTHPWNGWIYDWREVEPPEDPIGVIGSAQEPGYKFRAFAAPSPVLQGALEPLKSKLLQALHQLPWDCTHNQEKGVVKVQSWLSQGKTCYSVDLSDATNNFPLSLQIETLNRLGVPEEQVKLLEMVSRSPFKVTWKEDGTSVRWTVGQPLGAGPSFMAFALAHAVVALDAEIAAGIPLRDLGTTFCILGDDFVTNHAGVHDEYRKRLHLLSVPISEPKCLESDLAGEFAGKVILPDRVFHGYKYKEVSDLSFMSVLRTLGKQAVSRQLLTEDQYAYAKLVESLPEPFGLGFNPQGTPLADRYEEYLVLSEQLEALKRPKAQFSVAELRNKVLMNLRGFSSPSGRNDWWMHDHPRFGVIREDTVLPEVPYPVDESSLFERVRRVKLTSATTVKGDPRPNPIEDWKRKHATTVGPILDKLRAVRREAIANRKQQPDNASSVNCLAPSVLPEGETNPEREPAWDSEPLVSTPSRPRAWARDTCVAETVM